MVDLRRQAFFRFWRKRTYWSGKLADEAAQRASAKAGELIISYQCYECRQWHIGHADLCQILARTPPNGLLCEVCGQPIPAARIHKAKEWNSDHHLFQALQTRT